MMRTFAGGGGGSSSPDNKPDTYFSDDVVEVVLGISEGQIKGLKEGTAKNFYIGETPLLNANNLSNFTDFELNVHPGSSLGELIVPRLGGQSSSITVNTQLAQNIAVVRQGTQLDIDWLELRFIIHSLVSNTDDGTRARDLEIRVEYKPSDQSNWRPGILYADTGTTVDELGNSLRVVHHEDRTSALSTARKQVIYDQEETPDPTTAERGLGDLYGHRVWWINSEDENFAPRFYSNGEFFTPDELVVDEDPARESAEFEDALYIALIDPSREDIKRKIFFWRTGTPVGARLGDLWLNPSSGQQLWFNGSSWVATLSPTGSYDLNAGHNVVSTNGVLRINEKITSNTVKEVKIGVDRIGVPYDVRVTKLSEDSSASADDRTDVSLESIQEVKAEPMRFPNLAVAHLLGRATDQFSSLPQFSGVYEGRLVKVPSNYDPEARTYTGVWDGTWKIAYSNNPAFVGNDLVENDRYGMNSTYPVTLDPLDVYEAGVWCDLRLPSGKPQFTFNQLIQQPQSARELATYVFGIFGGRFFDDGNGYARLRIDNDAPAVHLFTKENVKEGVFRYSYTEVESRINDYTVAFKNPALFYKEDRRRVFDQPAIEMYGRAPDDFIAVGCNNADEAVFRATVKLLSDQTETETVTFETAREGLYLEPYDIILVSDDTMDDVITGRIVGTEGARTVYLRDFVYLEAGFDHELVINRDDFEISSLDIASSSVGKATKILELAEDLPEEGIPPQAIFSIGQQAKPYRVLSIGESEGQGEGGSQGDSEESVIISAIQVNRTKYPTAAENPGSIQVEIPEFSTDLSAVQRPRITPWVEVRQGRPVQNLRVEWDPHPNKFVRTYTLQSRFEDDGWTYHGQVREPRFELFDVAPGRYLFSVQANALTGQKSVIAYVDIDLSGEVRSVAPIKDLILVNETETAGSLHLFDDTTAELQWQAGEDDPALSSFSVEIYNGDEELLRSAFVGTPSFSYTQTMFRLDNAPRQLKVVVKAFDTFGNSSDPVQILIKNPAPVAPLVALDRGFGSVQARWPVGAPDYVGSLVWISDEPDIDPTEREADFDVSGNALSIPAENGSAVYVRVALYDSFGKTELNYSQEVYALPYPLVDTEAPEKPDGLDLDSYIETIDGVVQRQILVATVDASEDDDFAYFDFEIKQNSGNWVSFPSSSPRYEWAVLPEQTYSVRVTAVDQFGNRSDATDEEELETPTCPELAELINAGSVEIDGGKILVHGDTMLSDWRNPGDLTTIDGNMLGTGTVSADKAVFGQRGITTEDIEFDYNDPSTNHVSWTAGTIRYIGDDGNIITKSIEADDAAWTSGTLFICYEKNDTELTATTDTAVAFSPDHVVLATYKGDSALNANYGRTIIDGALLKTGTVVADQARIGSIDSDAIQSDAIKSVHLESDAVTADKINVSDLSAISADLGSIIVDNAHIGHAVIETSNLDFEAVTGRDVQTGNLTLDPPSVPSSVEMQGAYFIEADPTKTTLLRATGILRAQRISGTAGIAMTIMIANGTTGKILHTGTINGTSGNFQDVVEVFVMDPYPAEGINVYGLLIGRWRSGTVNATWTFEEYNETPMFSGLWWKR